MQQSSRLVDIQHRFYNKDVVWKTATQFCLFLVFCMRPNSHRPSVLLEACFCTFLPIDIGFRYVIHMSKDLDLPPLPLTTLKVGLGNDEISHNQCAL